MKKLFDVLRRNANYIKIRDKNVGDYCFNSFYQIFISSKINDADLEFIKDNIEDAGKIIYLSKGAATGCILKRFLNNLQASLNEMENTTTEEALRIAYAIQENSRHYEATPYYRVRHLYKLDKEKILYINDDNISKDIKII